MPAHTILCCLNPACSIDEITERTFYTIIAPLATPLNLKIFSRDSQIKCFVQVASEEAAATVIAALNNKRMNIGKLKAFISHKKFIAYDRSIAELLRVGGGSGRVSPDRFTVSEHSGPDKADELDKEAEKRKGVESYSSVYVKHKMQEGKSGPQRAIVSDMALVAKNSDKKIISKEIISETGFSAKQHKLNPPLPEVCHSLTQLHELQSHSRVINSANCYIKVSNFDSSLVNGRELANLFGCFGNVPRLLLEHTAECALVEYENTEQGVRALKHLDCIRFGGRILTLETIVDTEAARALMTEGAAGTELICVPASDFRFADARSWPGPVMSRKLVINGFADSVSTASVRALIETMHKPTSIVPFADADTDELAFIVELKSISECLRVLSKLHRSMLDGYNLSVRFFNKAAPYQLN